MSTIPCATITKNAWLSCMPSVHVSLSHLLDPIPRKFPILLCVPNIHTRIHAVHTGICTTTYPPPPHLNIHNTPRVNANAIDIAFSMRTKGGAEEWLCTMTSAIGACLNSRFWPRTICMRFYSWKSSLRVSQVTTIEMLISCLYIWIYHASRNISTMVFF